MSDEPQIHIDGCFVDPKSCPKSNGGKCPVCGHELHGHYGFAGGYGLGVSRLCFNTDCDNGTIYDFVTDEG